MQRVDMHHSHANALDIESVRGNTCTADWSEPRISAFRLHVVTWYAWGWMTVPAMAGFVRWVMGSRWKAPPDVRIVTHTHTLTIRRKTPFYHPDRIGFFYWFGWVRGELCPLHTTTAGVMNQHRHRKWRTESRHEHAPSMSEGRRRVRYARQWQADKVSAAGQRSEHRPVQ